MSGWRRVGTPTSRRLERICLAFSSVPVVVGLLLVFMAKSHGLATFGDQPERGQILNLDTLKSPEPLDAVLLPVFPAAAERRFVARQVYGQLTSPKRPQLTNVGVLSRLSVDSAEVAGTSGLEILKRRQEEPATPGHGRSGAAKKRIPLLSIAQVRAIKPMLVVRDPEQFRRAFALWATLFLGSFWAVHFLWSIINFRGDQLVLPPVLLLCGIGLMLMTSLRDPLRDSELFVSFAQGVIGGCAIAFLASLVDYQRWLARLVFLPLLASFGLSILLLLFGTGPGASDAKVNLGPFQPVEAMRVCLVLFLAGYLAKRWQFLRELRETRPRFSKFNRYIEIPKLDHLLPVVTCVGLALLFFFLQKDLGPALLLTCLFLGLYGVARGRFGLPLAGLTLLFLGFCAGYWLGTPKTVVDRVQMFLSPWDNTVRGGDQLAGSLWSFASGGSLGTGPGLGETASVPAAHTDLILSAVAEEGGFVGFFAVFAAWFVLLHRGMRIAASAPTNYTFFLGLGCTLATALQILLISGGILGLLPLSGVVSPFLSYGRSAMLANFAIVGILLAISSQPRSRESARQFGRPLRSVSIVVFTLLCAVVARAAYLQVWKSDDVAIAGTLVRQQDGVRRLQYNPRLLAVARQFGRGSILDRNGIPLATSSWDEVVQHRAQYQELGIDIEKACVRADSRYYPLGGQTFHLLGDIRTRANWLATNTAYLERDMELSLRGFSEDSQQGTGSDSTDGLPSKGPGYHNYRVLLPLLRHRYEPNHPAVRRLREQDRTLRLTVDARLTVRVTEILQRHLRVAKKERGAVVVLDAASGAVLALVNVPAPLGTNLRPQVDPVAEGEYLDRARFGLYPPGSVFKLVTAAAALRVDPEGAGAVYACRRLSDHRVGAVVRGWTVRDDVTDREPHGSISLPMALAESCNAYFAQLAVDRVGAPQLFETARMLGIRTGSPDTPEQLRRFLPQAGYGQGEVLVSPLQIARVAAAIANGGKIPNVHFVNGDQDESRPLVQLLTPQSAAVLSQAMRLVVTDGTGQKALISYMPIAGKTGTAEVGGEVSHAWFAGFAPADSTPGRRIAFAVFVESGQYGGSVASPIAPDLVAAAADCGLLR